MRTNEAGSVKPPLTLGCPMCGRCMALVEERLITPKSEHRPVTPRRISRSYVCTNQCCGYERAA
jgi:hypothetical protein